ncbi:MAG: hypothetical protein K0R52_439 [Alphaproteobacteria bacterium]|jgi:hypothetical protein|nr:hypothetical protein [Alphaproteobacteria bacterium]
MSTRAVYTFKDSLNTFHVYKHWDGHPSGAAHFIEKSLKLTGELTRFEADEFGASFIVANKSGGGDVRLSRSYEDYRNLGYRYEISFKDQSLYVVAYQRLGGEPPFFDDDKDIEYEIIFSGSLNKFKRFALAERE